MTISNIIGIVGIIALAVMLTFLPDGTSTIENKKS